MYLNDLLGKANSAESSSTNPPNCPLTLSAWLRMSQPNAYVCSRCSKSFPTSQALGGHQNAHRKERSEARKLYIETRLAQIRKAKMPVQGSRPLKDKAAVPPNDGQINDHLVKPVAVAKPRSSYDLVPLPEPGKGYGSKDEQGLKTGLKKGSLGSGPIRASHENYSYHPYQKTVGKKLRIWGVNLSEESECMGRAGIGTWLEEAPHASDGDASSSTGRGGEGGTEVISKEELDLTLRL